MNPSEQRSSTAGTAPALPCMVPRPAPEGPASQGSRLLLIGITTAALVVYALHAWSFRALFRGNAVDDAYISYRYLDNLLSGHGLVYNPGEHVEGYSNLLWILLLAPPALLGGNIVLSAQVLGVLLGAAGIALGVHALRSTLGVRSPLGAAFVAFLLAGSGYYAAWSIAGLESMLYGLLLLGAWVRYHEEERAPERRPISAALFTCLAMTRPEGLLVALGAAAYHILRKLARGHALASRQVLLFLGVLGVLLGGYELFRLSTYGLHLFPNPVRAKTGGGIYQLQRGVGYFQDNFANPYLQLLAPLALVGHARRDAALLTAIALFAGHVFFVIGVGGDWSYGRFYAPLLPLGAVALAGACGRLVADQATWRSPVAALPTAVVATGYLLYAHHVTSVREQAFFGNFAAYDAERIAIGRWLADKAPEDTRIAVYAAGQIPYYSRLYAHDMLGLNDAHIAGLETRSMGQGLAGHEKSDPDYTLNVIRPQVIIDGYLVPGMAKRPELRERYRRVPLWQINAVDVTEDLYRILMQGEEGKATPPAP